MEAGLDYRHQPLAPDGSTFRLFIFLPGGANEPFFGQFLEVPVKSKPTYVALSYTWGESATVGYVLISGKRIAIGRNLYDALQRLRSTEHAITFWIDALCINQLDDE